MKRYPCIWIREGILNFRILGLVFATLGIALPLAAISETAPQVVVATPGSGGSHGGAINRYTLRFSEAMVALGDPRAPAPAVMRCRGKRPLGRRPNLCV